MRKSLSKITAFLMALLVLFSTFSFTMEKHICGGEVADYSFLGNVERCQMPQDYHSNELGSSMQKKGCCDDEIHVIERTNTELKTSQKVKLQNIQFALVFAYTYIDLFEGLEKNNTPFKDYSPPLITRDIQVLFDTFLI